MILDQIKDASGSSFKRKEISAIFLIYVAAILASLGFSYVFGIYVGVGSSVAAALTVSVVMRRHLR